MRPATAATTTWPGQQQLLLSRFHANNTQPQKYFHWYSLVLELPHERLWGGGGCSNKRLQQVATATATNASGAFGPDFAPQSTVWAIPMPDFRLMWRLKAAENDIRYRWLLLDGFMVYGIHLDWKTNWIAQEV